MSSGFSSFVQRTAVERQGTATSKKSVTAYTGTQKSQNKDPLSKETSVKESYQDLASPKFGGSKQTRSKTNLGLAGK